MTGQEPMEIDAHVFASEEGREYRASFFIPTAADNLDLGPAIENYPDRGACDEAYRALDLPRVP